MEKQKKARKIIFAESQVISDERLHLLGESVAIAIVKRAKYTYLRKRHCFGF